MAITNKQADGSTPVWLGSAFRARVNDERNNSRIYGHYSSSTVAQAAVKGKSDWGSDGRVESIPLDTITIVHPKSSEELTFIISDAIKVVDSLEEDEEHRTMLQAKAALRKLSEKEREALAKIGNISKLI